MWQEQSDALRSTLKVAAGRRPRVKSVLVIDVGGTSVKILATGQPESLVVSIRIEETCRADWTYDAVSIGYPGPVLSGRPSAEPVNLGRGWIAFDFAEAFGRPVKVMNDAAMQALGSYKGGKMLFLGLGTGLGTALIDNGVVKAMELGHLPYKKGRTTSDVPAWSAAVRRSGGVMWPTSSSGSRRPCGRMTR